MANQNDDKDTKETTNAAAETQATTDKPSFKPATKTTPITANAKGEAR